MGKLGRMLEQDLVWVSQFKEKEDQKNSLLGKVMENQSYCLFLNLHLASPRKYYFGGKGKRDRLNHGEYGWRVFHI